MTSRSLLFLLWLLLMLTGILCLRGTTITHDLAQFLPKGATPEQQLAVSLLRTGPTSRLILIALENASGRELADTSRHMTRLLEESGQFSLVSNGTQINSDQLDLAFRYRYLLDPDTGTSSFSEYRLHQALQQRLNELSGALPLADRKLLEADPTAALRSVLDSWHSDQQPRLRHGVWFSVDDEQALVVATTRESGFDPEAQQPAIKTIHEAFAASKTAANTRLLLSGAPVFANNARNTIRSGLKTLSITASILVAVFLLFAYRSFYFLILGGLPILTGLVAGSVTTSLLFGNIHGITLVFGITLLGVAIDYPIHLFSHLEASKTPNQSIRNIWNTLGLGVITTCIGYLAFARQDFTGLSQLGVFTTSGLLTAAAITRWLLPSLLGKHQVPKIPGYQETGLHTLLHLRQPIALAILVTAIISLALLLALSPPDWETDISALSPLSSEERRLDASLRAATGAADANQLIVINAANLEAASKTSEQVSAKLQGAVERGLLSDFEAVTRYLPSISTQQQRQASLPDAEAAKEQLAAAMRGLPYTQDAFQPFLDALSDSRTLSPLTLQDMEGTTAGLRIKSLISGDNSDRSMFILLSGITSVTDFHDWWLQQGFTGTQLIDLKKTSSVMLAEFRNSALERLALGTLLILGILSIGLRSLPGAFRILLPVILAIGLTTALLGICGERLSLFHLVALLLTTGIGIDYSLFFHRREIQGTEQRATFHALIVCVISTFTVFGILSISPVPVLHATGITVTIGVPLCFLLALASARQGYRETLLGK